MLGIDWMQKEDVQWQFGSGAVTIRNRQFLLTSRNNALACRRLVVTQDVRVPPRSEINVATRFNERGSGTERAASDWATETMELKDGLLVAGAVLPHRVDNLPVRILNTSNREVFVRKRQRSGRGQPGDRRDGGQYVARRKPSMTTWTHWWRKWTSRSRLERRNS